MSPTVKRIIGVILGAYLGARVTWMIVSAYGNANPDVASGKAFGWEGAEAMIIIPILLGVHLLGAIIGAAAGFAVASLWK